MKEMGKYNEALEIYNQVDKIQTDILGKNHTTTLRTKNKLAICLLRRDVKCCRYQFFLNPIKVIILVI